MSLARDDIHELHSKASGLSHNYRDASGGTGGTHAYVNLHLATQLIHVYSNYCVVPPLPSTDGGTNQRLFSPEK